MDSYDIKALFTSVPMDLALAIFQNRLQQDCLLPHRTSMSVPQIITLLVFCLKNTYILFEGKCIKQVDGASMYSFISPLIANLFMEEYEIKAIRSAPTPIYGSGMFMTHFNPRGCHCHQLLQHINFKDPHVQFTIEDPNEDGALPFLDTLVSPGSNNTLKHQWTENLPTWTNISSGTVTIFFWLNTAFKTPCQIGQGWSAQVSQQSIKNMNTLDKLPPMGPKQTTHQAHP